METIQEKIEKSFKENSPRIAIKKGEKYYVFRISSFIKKLDQEVKINSSNATWKEKYNMLLAREEMLREEGMQEGLKEGREKQYHFILKMIKSNQLSYESCVENVEDKDDFVAWYQAHK